jgi:N-acetylglutamate synthase-like GNAT family acetyltransferase
LVEDKTKLLAPGISVRTYNHGDEAQIVSLLNTCFGNWGPVEKWNAEYLQYPSFDEKDVFVIEKEGKIIGHEALHFRDLVVDKESVVSTVSLSDAAVHPDFRGQGLHNKLLDIMLQEAKLRSACLVFSWYLRGSGLHKHSEEMGFVEIEQPPAYMKIIRPEKLLRSGLLDFLHKSPGAKEKIGELSNDIYLSLDKATFSLAGLIGKCSPQVVQPKRKIEIVFYRDSINSLVKFRNMTKRQRLFRLILLLMLRRVRIKFGSFTAFMNFARKGLYIIGFV